MAAVSNRDIPLTIYDVISSCCGLQSKHAWTYYLSLSVFNILGITLVGGGGNGIRLVPEEQ